MANDPSLEDVPPTPPAGLNYTINVQHSMTLALLATMFASLLLPMLIALLFFASQHACRKTHIFWFNVAALTVGIVEAIYLVAIQLRSAIHPPLPDPYILGWYVMSFYTPIFVECLLVFRLVAVYRVGTTSPMLQRFMVGFPIFLKMFRFGVVTVLLAVWIACVNDRNIPVESGLMGWSRFPYPRIAWGLQLLDNTFCTYAFIQRLQSRVAGFERLRRSSDQSGVKSQAYGGIRERVRVICRIALFNYGLPTTLGAIHLIMSLLDLQWDDVTWMYLCSYLMILNNYFTIIGVAFATIWASSREWAGSHTLCMPDVAWTCGNHNHGPSANSSRTLTFEKPLSATSSNFPISPSPVSPRFWNRTHPSGLPTPMSPVFHYDLPPPGHHSKSLSADLVNDKQLRIYVARTIAKRYEVEGGDETDEIASESITPSFSSLSQYSYDEKESI
ncbi:hypothetical protein DL96DRAFT_507265 [Flagelloscypha sp. PMI_526]|nr:hypothetical protein DL96DRAFT_507265 [Flagelloscypha sp. PMI_526]